MSDRMIAKTFYLTSEMVDMIEKLAVFQRVSESEIARQVFTDKRKSMGEDYFSKENK